MRTKRYTGICQLLRTDVLYKPVDLKNAITAATPDIVGEPFAGAPEGEAAREGVKGCALAPSP